MTTNPRETPRQMLEKSKRIAAQAAAAPTLWVGLDDLLESDPIKRNLLAEKIRNTPDQKIRIRLPSVEDAHAHRKEFEKLFNFWKRIGSPDIGGIDMLAVEFLSDTP